MIKFPSFRRPVDIEKQMQQAVASYAAGRLGDAENACRKLLQVEPRHAEAMNMLGSISLAQGKAAEAVQRFGEALTIAPGSIAVRFNEAAAFVALGRHADALASYDHVLTIDPNRVEARCKRANLLRDMRRIDDAEADFVKALEIQPDDFDALAGLGNLLDAQGRVEEALAALSRAIDVRPNDRAARNDRASVYFKQGRFDEAMADWEWVLARDPDNSVAHSGRGSVFYARGEYDAALAEYDRAVELAPDFAGAPYNRALVLNTLRRYDEAIAAYQWAIAIKPDFVQAMFNCAVLQEHQNRDDEALATFQNLIAVDPEYPHTRGNVAFMRAKMCAWDGGSEFVTQIVRDVTLRRHVTVPLNFLSMSHDAAAQRTCAETLVERFRPADAKPRWTGQIYTHDRIRVAYLSADFHEHPTAFLSAGLFERHDHTRFEVIGVVFGLDHASPMRKRIEATFDRVVDIRKESDAQVATLLRDMEIDIAVDMMGFTNWSRTGIFASRFAPVQVNYLGYPGTMGANYIDYIIADRFLIPDALRPHYTEKICYLPDTFQVNDDKRRIAERPPTRVQAGLPDGSFVFCCFNNSYKITSEMFSIWMRLLERVPGSVLWLVAGNLCVEPNLRREAERRGIAPSRLVFAKRLPADEYLAQYRLADLFLDTLPFNGGATVSDALWAGLPVVTCAGEAFAARMAGSLLHAIGLPELITHSLPEYEALALRLATDKPRLLELKERLAHNRVTHPLFDTDRFRRHIEAAYVTMWEKTQRGEPPSTFTVERES